jgi:hypothetical protein
MSYPPIISPSSTNHWNLSTIRTPPLVVPPLFNRAYSLDGVLLAPDKGVAGQRACCLSQGENGMRGFLEEKWPELAILTGFGIVWLAIVMLWF